MNKRLKKIEELIPYGKGIIDVGTDHGYIPIYLAQNGYTGNIIASDINEGPLNTAIKNAQSCGLESRISFVLSDGLKDCDPELIDTIVAAGMGGDLICRILDESDWCMNSCYTLILQPMTKPEILRYWLINNGFSVKDHIVHEGRFYYQILTASFTGKNESLTDAELHIGRFSDIRDYDFCREYLNTEIDRFSKDLCGLKKSQIQNENKILLYELILQQLKGMRDKLDG